ncbi:MAG TPA: VTT domain-containing protein [Dehalococcoidia bacterium]|nr:VTT domain-containing protein [Dehalococcoidia bacterium]
MNSHKQVEVQKGERLRNRAIPLLILILVLAITIALFLFFQQNLEKIKEFQNFGYPGAFLISLVSTATIILPTPGLLLLIALGIAFNPVLVGLVGAVGGTVGEITGYVLGHSGRGLTQRNKLFVKAEGWMKRGGFVTIFLFSLLPFLPVDIVGILAGALRFPIWKFLLACFFGKAILYVVMVQTGGWGWESLLH